MSNAKWRKFFITLDRAGVRVGGARWKLLGSDRLFSCSLPSESDLTASGIKDGRFYPMEFKEIQFIEIPSAFPDPGSDPNRPLPPLTQDLEKILAVLQCVGQFPIERQADSLVVKGYEPD